MWPLSEVIVEGEFKSSVDGLRDTRVKAPLETRTWLYKAEVIFRHRLRLWSAAVEFGDLE